MASSLLLNGDIGEIGNSIFESIATVVDGVLSRGSVYLIIDGG